MFSKKKLYVYSNPNQMDGYKKTVKNHKYTDDVAICYAKSLEEAIDRFSLLYERADVIEHTKEAIFNFAEICICTDY